MKTHSVTSYRIGLATNSSSTHSVVLFAPGKKPMSRAQSYLSADEYDNNWVAETPREKLIALIVAGEIFPDDYYALKECGAVSDREDFDKLLEETNAQDFPSMEGQKVRFNVPQGIDRVDYLRFFLSDGVAIYGYFDNYRIDEAHPELGGENAGNWQGFKPVSYNWKGKKEGDSLIFFNQADGRKIRWSREGYRKSETPELVDVKITDFCDYGCAFCYQDSTEKGKDAPLSRIKEILTELVENNVFEVAMGGGEPTKHKHFAEIMRFGADLGIVMNFTTYGLDWLKNKEIMDAILYANKKQGVGIGVSVHKAADLKKASRIIHEFSYAKRPFYGRRPQVTAQTVMGILRNDSLLKMVDESFDQKVPLLLLGYKTTGRGDAFEMKWGKEEHAEAALSYAKYKIDEYFEKWGCQPAWRLSCDTAFIEQYEGALDRLEIPQMLRSSPEGQFSCYIDAVTNEIAPSSYCDESEYRKREKGKLKEQFAEFGVPNDDVFALEAKF